MNIGEIEKTIGYTFGDKGLLRCAFTHSSYANDKGLESYERLEFLGDALLGFIIADNIYRAAKSDEGDMTVKRTLIVSKQPLCRVMTDMKLSSHILFGQSVKQKEKIGKAHSDVFEAMVSAVYLDGGMDAARRVVNRLLNDEIIKSLRSQGDLQNYKGLLQEYAQERGFGLPDYILLEKSGSAHQPSFRVQVVVGGEICGEGNDGSQKAAEKQAAKDALTRIQNKHN